MLEPINRSRKPHEKRSLELPRPPQKIIGRQTRTNRPCSPDKHKTSISLEDLFWLAFKELVAASGRSIADTVSAIDMTRTTPNLSSAIRVWILEQHRAEIAALRQQLAAANAAAVHTPPDAVAAAHSADRASAQSERATHARPDSTTGECDAHASNPPTPHLASRVSAHKRIAGAGRRYQPPS